MNLRYYFPVAALSVISVFRVSPSLGQDGAPQLLDGTEIQYTYSDGGAVVLTFYNGLLKFLWIAGPFEGATGEDLPYDARAVADDIFLVNWHDLNGPSFVTLVINLQHNTLYSSALLGYQTDEELSLFDEATIERVER